MLKTITRLVCIMILPLATSAQGLNVPDLSPAGDLAFFSRKIEQGSPALQKFYSSLDIRADMTLTEAKNLIQSKLAEYNNEELNQKYAQLDPEQVVRAGIILYALLNGLSNTDDFPGTEYKARLGMGFGVFLMYTLANMILMPELTLMFRGYGQESSNNTYVSRFTYLNLAFTAMYIIRAETLRLLVGLSPMLGYALGGKHKNGSSQDIEFGDEGANRINFGLGITAGIMLQNSIIVRLLYNFGLSKLYSQADYRMYMMAIAISVPLWNLR